MSKKGCVGCTFIDGYSDFGGRVVMVVVVLVKGAVVLVVALWEDINKRLLLKR